MTTWFTGCQHFGHKNIINLAQRPFDTVDKMDDHMVDAYNARVKSGDVVYSLGDFAWKKHDEYAKRLKHGFIVHLLGNHDEERVMTDALAGRGIVVPSYYEQLSDLMMVLCHYPIEDWNGRFRGNLHLHCHTHSKTFASACLPTSPDWLNARQLKFNRFNVGVDAIPNFAPVSLHQVRETSKGRIPSWN